MNYLNTPFGKVKILIDDTEIPYKAEKKQPNESVYPNIIGRYHIGVDFIPDGKRHEIKCIIENMSYSDRGPESGERLECQAFYSEDNFKLSIAVECETGFLPDGTRYSDRYDYDAGYLENGMSYIILEETREEHFIFGIAWIDNVEDNHARDVQTWFAADPTY
ncbi:MAG: hypothetical protein IJZ72_04330 [Oscillospiraceae bacterium]|nr:hypothetical protein [Oscillospiraceae bacterium]